MMDESCAQERFYLYHTTPPHTLFYKTDSKAGSPYDEIDILGLHCSQNTDVGERGRSGSGMCINCKPL